MKHLAVVTRSDNLPQKAINSDDVFLVASNIINVLNNLLGFLGNLRTFTKGMST